MNILKHKITIVLLALVVGLILGKFIFSNNEKESIDHSQHEAKTNEVWTCSMHPQIRQNEPGDCPICGMDLIPVDEVGDNPLNMEMSQEAIRLANIQTSKVELMKPEKEIFIQGRVKMDERRISIISSRFAGRIEKLFIDFTGVRVSKGQKLASIYSPELITAQQELFEAIKFKESNPTLYKAARNKLKLWNITENQINDIETNGKPKQEIDIVSPLSGVVISRSATLGDYVKEGTMLFEIVDLNNVWLVFDAYESDIPWISVGDEINFKVSSLADQQFNAKVEFIDPIINPQTRVASVRSSFNNSKGSIKPEMFVEGKINAVLPINESKIAIPKSAVMWTGKRSIVYIELPDTDKPTFQFREVVLGMDLGLYFIVERGLNEGDKIVTNGTFKVDAAAQLAGKNSMMTQESSINTYHVSEGFRQNLTLFFNAYIELKNTLVASDFTSAQKQIFILEGKFKLMEKNDLHDEALDLWKKESKSLKASINDFLLAQNIEDQRSQFKSLSESLSKLVGAFGLHGKVAYKDYCPMAINDKGAIWLSEIKEIRNPYFGDKMLKCGEVKKIFGNENKTKKASVSGHNH